MRRFINADVIHGEISDSTSLNRYSYVNGNPVSFVDPFGLSKEERTRGKDNSSYAIYVVDYDAGPGFPVVGHTKLYFICDDGSVVLTEYTGENFDKSTAQVQVYKKDYSLKTLESDLKRANDSWNTGDGSVS